MRHLTLTAVFALLVGALVGAQAYQRVDFNKLSNYEYELPDPFDPTPRTLQNTIPDAVKALDGRQVSIEGFMLPLDLNPDGVSQFMLNASIDMCYFGAPVRMNEWILVKMKGGTRAKFTHLALNVKGRLDVGEEMKNGRVASLYRLEADSAEIEGGR
jgi:hypothetical protein